MHYNQIINNMNMEGYLAPNTDKCPHLNLHCCGGFVKGGQEASLLPWPIAIWFVHHSQTDRTKKWAWSQGQPLSPPRQFGKCNETMVVESRGDNAAIAILPDKCQTSLSDGGLDHWNGHHRSGCRVCENTPVQIAQRRTWAVIAFLVIKVTGRTEIVTLSVFAPLQRATLIKETAITWMTVVKTVPHTDTSLRTALSTHLSLASHSAFHPSDPHNSFRPGLHVSLYNWRIKWRFNQGTAGSQRCMHLSKLGNGILMYFFFYYCFFNPHPRICSYWF